MIVHWHGQGDGVEPWAVGTVRVCTVHGRLDLPDYPMRPGAVIPVCCTQARIIQAPYLTTDVA